MGKSGQLHVSVSWFADDEAAKPNEMKVGLTPGTVFGTHLVKPIPQNSSS